MYVDTIIDILFIHELSMELLLVPTRQFLVHKIKFSSPVKYKEIILTIVDLVPDTTIVNSVRTTPEITNPARISGTSSVISSHLMSFLQSIASNR